MSTYTSPYQFELPTVGGDINVWGGKCNTNFQKINDAISTVNGSVLTVSGNLTTLDGDAIKKSATAAQTMSGPLVLYTATPVSALHAASKSYVDTVAAGALISPAFTGTPTAPTAAADTNTTQLATTAYVVGQGYLKATTATTTYAPLASPALTGTPTAPTASAATNNTQIATTAYVTSAVSTAINALPAAETTILLTTDQLATNTTTYAANSTLTIPMVAGGLYEFEAVLIVVSQTTGGGKITLNALPATTGAPQGGSGVVLQSSSATTGLFTSISNIATPTVNLWTTAAIQAHATVVIKGSVLANATTASTLQIYFAQNTANATASRLRAGSILKYRRTV